MSTTWTGYRTGYVRATDTRGAKILVMNLETNHGKHQAFDHEYGGGIAQHRHALTQAASGTIVRIERCGQWKDGYYFVVERVEED